MSENIMSAIPSIDWNLSIKLANNNIDLAKDLLEMFVEDLPNVTNAIHTAHNNQDYTELASQVHKLHGASCYCGVTHLKLLLGKMELALKEKLYSQFNEFLKEFDTEVNEVLSAYKLANFM